MKPITDPALRLLLLAELVRDPVGLSKEQAAQLQALSAPEFVKLAAMREPEVTVTLSGSIALGLQRAEAVQRREILIEYFIVHGATHRLIEKVFPGVNAAVVTAARKRLSAAPIRRPKMPRGPSGMRECELIQARWWELSRGKDSAEAYFALHRLFPTWGLGSLHIIVHQDDELATEDVPKQRRRSPEQRAGA